MRLLQIDSGDTMQGGQWQVLYLLRGLRDRGVTQRLVARGDLARRARQEGFDVAESSGYDGFDLVHAHDARAHTRCAIWCRRPFVVSRRVGFPVRRGPLSHWKYRRATHFIAVSNYVARTLAAAGLKPDRVSVVYDGVPVGEYRTPSAGGPVVAVLKDPASPLLLRAGRAAGVEIRPLNRIEEDMAGAAAFAYVSDMQGLGSAAIFAMASGVPVIASRAGGLPEIVVHDETGLLVDNTEEDIAAALVRLRTDRALAIRLSRQAYDRVKSAFSIDAMVDGTKGIYERLLG